MNAENIREFLSIRDISLWSCSFSQPTEFHAPTHAERMIAQARRAFTHCEQVSIDEEDGKKRDYLHARCQFGLRGVISPSDEKAAADPRSDPEIVLFQIEATFRIGFLINKPLSDDDLDSFLGKSCMHMCWAFWRQHVFDTLKRASLPLIEVPLSCPPTSGKVKSTKASKRDAGLSD